jgi:hypothetical protein
MLTSQAGQRQSSSDLMKAQRLASFLDNVLPKLDWSALLSVCFPLCHDYKYCIPPLRLKIAILCRGAGGLLSKAGQWPVATWSQHWHHSVSCPKNFVSLCGNLVTLSDFSQFFQQPSTSSKVCDFQYNWHMLPDNFGFSVLYFRTSLFGTRTFRHSCCFFPKY